ncbi:hypothetical protein ACFSTC_32745 [Nonomuraea ferruginea]
MTETLSTVERRPEEPSDRPAPPTPQAGRRAGAFWRLLVSELSLTFHRPRNLAMLAALATVPVIMGVSLRLFAGDDQVGGMIAAVARQQPHADVPRALGPGAADDADRGQRGGRATRSPARPAAARCATCSPRPPGAPGCWPSST